MIVSNLKDKSISCLNLKDNVIYEVRDTSLYFPVKRGDYISLLYKNKEKFIFYNIINRYIFEIFRDDSNLFSLHFEECYKYEIEGFRNKSIIKINELKVGYVYYMIFSSIFTKILVLKINDTSICYFNLDKFEMNTLIINIDSFKYNFKEFVSELKIL